MVVHRSFREPYAGSSVAGNRDSRQSVNRPVCYLYRTGAYDTQEEFVIIPSRAIPLAGDTSCPDGSRDSRGRVLPDRAMALTREKRTGLDQR